MREGQATEDEDREVVIVLEGHRAGNGMRENCEGPVRRGARSGGLGSPELDAAADARAAADHADSGATGLAPHRGRRLGGQVTARCSYALPRVAAPDQGPVERWSPIAGRGAIREGVVVGTSIRLQLATRAQ